MGTSPTVRATPGPYCMGHTRPFSLFLGCIKILVHIWIFILIYSLYTIILKSDLGGGGYSLWPPRPPMATPLLEKPPVWQMKMSLKDLSLGLDHKRCNVSQYFVVEVNHYSNTITLIYNNDKVIQCKHNNLIFVCFHLKIIMNI